MSRFSRLLTWAGLVFGLSHWAVSAAADQGAADLEKECASFKVTTLPSASTVVSVQVREAKGVFPEACIVRGTTTTSPTSNIQWAVELPAKSIWNGKTITFGGGGFDGFTPTDAEYYHLMAGPNAAPYVRMGSDSGHQVTGFYPWALDDDALRNHAYLANHLTLETGTAVATAFYGKAPIRRYMLGQSNGGRSGLVAAERYPNDYDGVIAIEPAINQQAHMLNLGATTIQHIFSDRQNWMDEAAIALFAKAETKACDGLDGLEDGIIANIAACHYAPEDLLCNKGTNEACLTPGQVESIRKIYNDQTVAVTLADGSNGYARFGRGGASTTDWRDYLFGTDFEKRDAFNYMAATEGARVVEGSEKVAAFPHDATQFRAQYLRLSKEMDPITRDLSEFAKDGKLIIWYGTADSCVSIYQTARYFDALKQNTGADVVAGFARFLVTPGIGHEMTGPGPIEIDLVSALDAWVESGRAPDDLIVVRSDPQTRAVLLERPTCEFPKYARYNGKGDPNRATSFSCTLE